jgi:hypothetical protein
MGLSAAFAQAGEEIEPPLQYQLKIGKTAQAISEGVPATFEGTFTNPAVLLEVAPERIFPYGGVTFSYPRHYTFEADFTSPGLKIWTLSGNNFKIMHFVTGELLTADVFLTSMMQQIDSNGGPISTEPVSITLGGQSVTGRRLRMTLANQAFYTDAYALPRTGGQSRLLVLQDALTEAGEASPESATAIGLLSRSFVLSP